jgi:hypothetical protein
MKKEFEPKYPFYIISKGRSDTMLTSRTLAQMKQPHYIAIEPQDEALYEQALDNFKIREYVTLLVAPFSNHGDGPGRARNWCWDHAIELGAERHWVMDDNIDGFYRLHNNLRVRCKTPAYFRACEDFVDRYENLPIAGLQYRMFAAPRARQPALIFNTRIYSCLLIENSCKHRWRGRYNEDTDLSLRVLKDGDCTLQFNSFLQEKLGTQVLKGGNTAEFYHAEGSITEWKGAYKVDGTINKSKMLEQMHPDVAKVVWKFGRWHHHVDYSSFRNNKLRFKPGVVIPKGNKDYGMVLIDNPEDPRWMK